MKTKTKVQIYEHIYYITCIRENINNLFIWKDRKQYVLHMLKNYILFDKMNIKSKAAINNSAKITDCILF